RDAGSPSLASPRASRRRRWRGIGLRCSPLSRQGPRSASSAIPEARWSMCSFLASDESQEFSWANRLYSELLRALKILHVMGDYIRAAGGYREFQDQVVVGIRQTGSPVEVDLLEV